MYNANVPSQMEVPSTKQLLKSTAIAAVTAGALLVTVVMPAEYGIDPTGLGEVLKLTEQGRIKMALAKEVEAEQAAAEAAKAAPALVEVATPAPQPEPATANAVRSDEMKVTLANDQGTEIKVTMLKGEKVNYVFFTDGGEARFDIHGDSKALNINYHGYEKGATTRKEGVLEAAFDGNHGWFWRNRTGKPLTVTLQTNGTYSAIKEMK